MTYLEELKALYKRAEKESTRNPLTSLAALLETCERSLRRWLDGDTTPIHRYRVAIHLRYEEMKDA